MLRLHLGRTDNAVYAVLSSALIRLGQRDEGLKVRAMAKDGESASRKRKTASIATRSKSLLRTRPATCQRLSLESSTGVGRAVAARCPLRSILIPLPRCSQWLTCSTQQRRPAEAIPVYERLIKLQPENLYNYNNLASLAVSVGNVPLAESALRQASKVDPTGNATLRLADFLLRLATPRRPRCKPARQSINWPTQTLTSSSSPLSKPKAKTQQRSTR